MLNPDLKIIDKNFVLQGVIDTYSSFQGERALWEIGKFELHVGLNDQGADALQKGNLVMIDEKRVWEITGVRKTEDNDLSLMVTGRELKGIFAQRVVIPDVKDDSHYYGWDRSPAEGDELEFAQILGASTQTGAPTPFAPIYPTFKTVGGHQLYSLPNGVADEITTDGKLVRRIYKQEITSALNNGSQPGIALNMVKPCEYQAMSNNAYNIYCSHCRQGNSWSGNATEINVARLNGTGTNILFSFDKADFPTADEVNAFLAALDPPLTFYYELAEPVIIDLELTVPFDATAETLIRHYVRKHATNPSDTRRQFPDLEMAPYQGRGMRTVWSERFKPLDQTLRDIGEHTGMGYKVTVDLENKRFVFDVIPERVQTAGADNPVVMSVDFENIERIEYRDDITNKVTVAYAGGAGEDENRLIQTVSRSPDDAALAGYARRETWQECGSIDSIDDLIYEAQYKLSQMEPSETLTCSVLPNSSLQYLVDWDIGSIVTVQSKALGIEQAKKITSVKEVYERGRVQIIPTFGKRTKTILDEIRKAEVVR